MAGKVDAQPWRSRSGFALSHVKDGNVELRAHDLQLLDRSRTVDVTRDEQRTPLLLFLEQTSELGAVGRFTGALQDQPASRSWAGWEAMWIFWLVASPCSAVSSSFTIFTIMLRRSQALEHIRADRAARWFS